MIRLEAKEAKLHEGSSSRRSPEENEDEGDDDKDEGSAKRP